MYFCGLLATLSYHYGHLATPSPNSLRGITVAPSYLCRYFAAHGHSCSHLDAHGLPYSQPTLLLIWACGAPLAPGQDKPPDSQEGWVGYRTQVPELQWLKGWGDGEGGLVGALM